MAYRSVVVIGGGAAGAAITRALAARGVGVTLLEKAGQLCSLKISIGKHTEKWLRPAARHAGGNIRKGMVLLDYSKKKVQASFSFKAEIWSFDGKVHTIKKTMQPVILT